MVVFLFPASVVVPVTSVTNLPSVSSNPTTFPLRACRSLDAETQLSATSVFKASHAEGVEADAVKGMANRRAAAVKALWGMAFLNFVNARRTWASCFNVSGQHMAMRKDIANNDVRKRIGPRWAAATMILI